MCICNYGLFIQNVEPWGRKEKSEMISKSKKNAFLILDFLLQIWRLREGGKEINEIISKSKNMHFNYFHSKSY